MGTEWPMSADCPVGPAILVHHVGQGTVLTCAASPDYATASEHAITEARTLFGNAFRSLLPQRRVDVTAPANVEVVVTDQPEARKLRVHLLAYHPTPRTTPQENRPFALPGLIEDTPLYRVRVDLSASPREVSFVDPTTQWRWGGRKIEATVEQIHDGLVIGY
jgi:hypothetical protein